MVPPGCPRHAGRAAAARPVDPKAAFPSPPSLAGPESTKSLYDFMTSERYNARESEPRRSASGMKRRYSPPKTTIRGRNITCSRCFPYPSGRIHIGHVRNTPPRRRVARFMRAKGFNVLHPMAGCVRAAGGKCRDRAQGGAEGVDLRQHRRDEEAAGAVDGLSLDWSREFATCDRLLQTPAEDVLDFLRAGLAEREKRKINWDPVDMTVLRQRAGDRRPRLALRRGGRAARDESVGVQDHQIFAGIAGRARHAGPLADTVRLLQRNWIGRSEGLLVRFALDPATTPDGERELKIFTTRPDTLFGARFMAIAADHRWRRQLRRKMPNSRSSSRRPSASAPRRRLSTPPRSRVSTPASARSIHSIPSWKLPVYVANFVLMEYGTGAIFERRTGDLDFVNKYGLGNTPAEGQARIRLRLPTPPMTATAA